MSKIVIDRALVGQALDYVEEIMKCPGRTAGLNQRLATLAYNILRAALAEQQAQQGCMRCNTPNKCALYGCSPLTWPSEQPAEQEPVWIQPNHLQQARRGPFLCRVEPQQREDFVALYPKAPQPAKPTDIPCKREPLTDEAIDELVRQNFGYITAWQGPFVRAIERAHGIGGQS